MADKKAICPCCNGKIDLRDDGKFVGHDRTEAGYCEGSNKTPEELNDTGCSESQGK